MIHPLPVESAAVLEGSQSTARFQHPTGDLLNAGRTHPTAAPARILELLLADLWCYADDMAASELHRAQPQLGDLSRGEREAIEVLATRLPRAILHRFVTRLQRAACTEDRVLIEAARFFLGVDAQHADGRMPMWRSNGSEAVRSEGGDQ